MANFHFVHHRFRRGFAQFFFWCPWVRVTTEPALSRSEAVTSRYSYTGSPDMHTRISRNGTCSPSEYTCSTSSITSSNESHVEHTNAQGNTRISLIHLRVLAPGVVTDDADVVSMPFSSYTDPCKVWREQIIAPILNTSWHAKWKISLFNETANGESKIPICHLLLCVFVQHAS